MSAPTSSPFKKIRQYLEAPAAWLGWLVIPLFPRWLVLFTAKWAGKIAFYASGRLRKMGMANLDLAYGDTKTVRDKKVILKKSLSNFALVLLDLFWFLRNPQQRLTRWVVTTPEFEKCIFNVGTFVTLTGHLGNWEAVGRFTAIRGFPLASVAMPIKNAAVDRMLTHARKITGQVVVPREGALRNLIRILREGHPVAMLLDQNTKPEEGGVFVNFFERQVPVSPAAASLAIRTHADILFGFGIPQPDGRYRMEAPFQIAIEPYVQMEKNAAILKLTQDITAIYERVVRQYPELWLWSYKRWKYIPSGEDSTAYPYYARPCPTPPQPTPQENPC